MWVALFCGWGSWLNTEKRMSWAPAVISLCFLTSDARWPAASSPSHHVFSDMTNYTLMGQNKPFLSCVMSVMWLHQYTLAGCDSAGKCSSFQVRCLVAHLFPTCQGTSDSRWMGREGEQETGIGNPPFLHQRWGWLWGCDQVALGSWCPEFFH